MSKEKIIVVNTSGEEISEAIMLQLKEKFNDDFMLVNLEDLRDINRVIKLEKEDKVFPIKNFNEGLNELKPFVDYKENKGPIGAILKKKW